MKKDGIDERKDGGCGTDAERERGHGHEGKGQTLAELSEGEAEIVGEAGDQGVHRGSWIRKG